MINRSNLAMEQMLLCITGLMTTLVMETMMQLGVIQFSILDSLITMTTMIPIYGLSPPAVGFQIVRGPLIQSAGDTARYYDPPGSNNFVVRPGFRLSGMSSFNMYTGGDPQCWRSIEITERLT
jgi:hypothetical protein